MTVTYVYCFSLLELSKSNKLIWYHSICLWIHFSQKHLFFHNFLKKWRDFFTIFKRNDTIFSQLVWYRTPSQFWKKNAGYESLSPVLKKNNLDIKLCSLWRSEDSFLNMLNIVKHCLIYNVEKRYYLPTKFETNLMTFYSSQIFMSQG